MLHKVVFVTDTLMSGGAERVISVIANSLSSKYQIEIICLRDKEIFYKIDSAIRIFSLPDCGWVKKFFILRESLKITCPDVVVAFMRNVYEFTMLSSAGLGLSIIPCERVDPKIAPLISKLIRSVVLPSACRFVVQTEEMKEYFSKFIQKKTVVISNPVDDSFIREPVPFDERCDVIISVGRLSPQKDFKTLIMAFASIADLFPSYKLVIYGDGPQRNELESCVRRLGLNKRIMFPGRSNEIYQELTRSKLFIQTSKFEGMSNAVMEAVCSGLPIITTDVSGAKQLVCDGFNGLIVGVGKTEDIANGIVRLLGNVDLLKHFSAASYSMRHKYRIDTISNKWEVLINEVIEK